MNYQELDLVELLQHRPYHNLAFHQLIVGYEKKGDPEFIHEWNRRSPLDYPHLPDCTGAIMDMRNNHHLTDEEAPAEIVKQRNEWRERRETLRPRENGNPAGRRAAATNHSL